MDSVSSFWQIVYYVVQMTMFSAAQIWCVFCSAHGEYVRNDHEVIAKPVT